jgi:hypothetical protein
MKYECRVRTALVLFDAVDAFSFPRVDILWNHYYFTCIVAGWDLLFLLVWFGFISKLKLKYRRKYFNLKYLQRLSTVSSHSLYQN